MGSIRSTMTSLRKNIENGITSAQYYGLKVINKYPHLRFSLLDGKRTSTFEPIEMIVYKSYLHEWWFVESPVKYLHRLNEIRIPLIYNTYCQSNQMVWKHLKPKTYLKDIKLLDVGCGGGLVSEALAELGFNVTGIDPNEHMIRLADDHAYRNKNLIFRNIRYEHTTIERFAVNNLECFDGLIISEVLDRVVDKKIFLKHCLKTLKPGGHLFITMKNQTKVALWNMFCSYFMNTLPIGSQNWLLFKPPEYMEKMLIEQNCSVRSVTGLFWRFDTSVYSYSEKTDFWYYMNVVKNG